MASRRIRCKLRHSHASDDGETIAFAPAGTHCEIIGFSLSRKLVKVVLEVAFVGDSKPQPSGEDDDCPEGVTNDVIAEVSGDALVFEEVVA